MLPGTFIDVLQNQTRKMGHDNNQIWDQLLVKYLMQKQSSIFYCYQY